MAQAAFPFALTTPSAPALALPGRTFAAGTHRPGTAANGTSPSTTPSAVPGTTAQPATLPAGLDATGFQIGWEHARHHLTPPVAHLQAESPVRQGWTAGRAAFGTRTRAATAAVRQWLQLRLQAWQQGTVFEDVQVTPHFLARIDATHCPATRQPLLLATGGPQDAVVQRLNPQAAYAAGNLAATSRAAVQARGPMGFAELHAQAQRVAETAGATLRGLDAAAWMRLAVLASFATPLPHAQAACLPLVVLPPNRVRVVNPVQALQVVLTLQFTRAGYARRLLTLAALMPGSEARQAFQIFMHTLLARHLARGAAQLDRTTMEDTWADPLVNRRWQRLALWLSPSDCEALLQRAGQRGLSVGGGRWMSAARATEGWNLTPQEGSAVPVGASTTADAAAAAARQALQAGTAGRASAPSSARKRGSQNLAS